MGTTLSNYLVREIAEIANRPTVEEMIERLHTREPLRVKGSIRLICAGAAAGDRIGRAGRF